MSEKIIWSEGMALSPHHFQQADWLQDLVLNDKLNALSPFNFGLAALEIDKEALARGYFSAKQCTGILPDGSYFAFPLRDTWLDARPFEEAFPAAKERLGVYVAAPSVGQNNPNFAFENKGSKTARYQESRREVLDLNTGLNAKPLVFGRMALSLLFEGESIAGFQTLKIAELTRDAQGKIILEENYIPPLLQIGASTSLMTRYKKLAESCVQKSNYLMSQRAQKATGIAQFTAETLTSYLLLSAIQTAAPGLLHNYNHPHAHPEALFQKLVGFAGSLLSFGSETKLDNLPAYRHGDLQQSFLPLFQLIESLLGATVPTGYRIFALTKTSPIQYLANLREADFAHIGQFYLGVTAQASEVDILTHVQRKSKVGPVGRLEAIVNSALPGIPLVPEANPPSSIPAKAGYKYFRLQQAGELWDQVRQGKALAIHLPSDMPSTKLELIAVLD